HRLRAALTRGGEVRVVSAFARRLRVVAARRGAVRVRLGVTHRGAVASRRAVACRVLHVAVTRGLCVPVLLRAYGDGYSAERDRSRDANYQTNPFHSSSPFHFFRPRHSGELLFSSLSRSRAASDSSSRARSPAAVFDRRESHSSSVARNSSRRAAS